MAATFYDQGCVPSSHWKWPAVAARRLLRRLQRPFFYELQSELEALRASDAAHRHELERLRAELQAKYAELRSAMQAEVADVNGRLGILDHRSAHAIDNAGLHPIGLMHKLESLDRSLRAVAGQTADRWQKPAPAPQPYRVLFALSSSCQMYSGIGRSIFETVKHLRGRVEYDFAMDDGDPRNVRILSEFCKDNGLTLNLGTSVIDAETMDRGNADLPALLSEQRWDAFEVASWGSSSTNQTILDHAQDTPIIYTPHYQPISSVPGAENCRRAIERAHFQLLRRSSLVVCLSSWEWLTLQIDAAESDAVFALLPHGIDPAAFAPGLPERRPYLLFVGDFRERRKRLDLTLDVFGEVAKSHPNLQLVIAGNKSDQTIEIVPEHLRRKIVLMGYVSEEQLRTLYRESMGLMLLSDYEAFGMPILEALACGTPAFITRRGTISTLFADYKGAVLIDDDRPEAMAKTVSSALDRWPELIRETLADAGRIAEESSWEAVSQKRYEAMRSALSKKVTTAR